MTPSDKTPSPFADIRKKAAEISSAMEQPAFYRDKALQVARAAGRAAGSGEVRFARDFSRERGGAFGHGFRHAELVAIDAGAIVYAEAGPGPENDRIADIALIAGFLHDIRRGEKDHPEKAAVEVADIFRGRLDGRSLEMVVFAIRNHEAFKDRQVVNDAEFMLCANALYDADKFRWGPDNFTDTIWDIAESMKVDMAAVMAHYGKGIQGIIRVKDTFRTETGRRYGPGFIDAGLEIGERLNGLYRQKKL